MDCNVAIYCSTSLKSRAQFTLAGAVTDCQKSSQTTIRDIQLREPQDLIMHCTTVLQYYCTLPPALYTTVWEIPPKWALPISRATGTGFTRWTDGEHSLSDSFICYQDESILKSLRTKWIGKVVLLTIFMCDRAFWTLVLLLVELKLHKSAVF